MVVWVAVRLARLATVAKNLHSQRRFSAMQAHPTLTLTLTLTLTVTLTLTLTLTRTKARPSGSSAQ